MNTEHGNVVSKILSDNIGIVMSDPGPPRLRLDTNLCVLAKTADGGECLIGGLGPFGVGRMWFSNLDHSYNSYPGFDTAPVVILGGK